MKVDEKWAEQFKDMGDMKDVVQAQQSTIIQQSKKIMELEKELEGFRNGSALATVELPLDLDPNAKDEEFIARFELHKFKNLSLQRSLTAEESKQVDTYAKLLMQLNANPKKDVFDAQSVPTEALLAVLGGKS